MKHIELRDLRVAAFVFTTREKDYGGLHLGVSAGDATTLIALIGELETAEPGYSRGVPLVGAPADLPQRIFARGAYQPVHRLRIAASAHERTVIEVEDDAALVQLSRVSLAQLRDLLVDLHRTGGDICLAGASRAWHDRLWIWPI